jgi:hypothetical protein
VQPPSMGPERIAGLTGEELRLDTDLVDVPDHNPRL